MSPKTYQEIAISRLKEQLNGLTAAYRANLNSPMRLLESVNQMLQPITKSLGGQAQGSRASDFKLPWSTWQMFLKVWANGAGDVRRAFAYLEETNNMVQHVR